MQVDNLLGIYKIKPSIVLESSEIATVKNLAMSGIGLTFVPESLAIEPMPSMFNLYELPIEQLNLDYFIAHNRNRNLSTIDTGLLSSFLRDKEMATYACNTQEHV